MIPIAGGLADIQTALELLILERWVLEDNRGYLRKSQLIKQKRLNRESIKQPIKIVVR